MDFMTTIPFALHTSEPSGLRFAPIAKPALGQGLNGIYRDLDLAKLLGDLGSRSVRRPLTVQRPTILPTPGSDQLQGQLFDSRANAKRIAASLSMHLAPDWRTRIYRQIDELLDADEMDDGSALLDPRSMQTFLRFVIFAGATVVPSLGLSPSGNIVAAWRRDTRRLTIEFLPNDRCRLAISHFKGDDPSIFTFSGAVTGARSYLQRETFALG
jgi:hypothetical protein